MRSDPLTRYLIQIVKRIPVVGIDFGQGRNPTGIAVVEMGRRPIGPLFPFPPPEESHAFVHHLERLAPGTRSPTVACRLGEICSNVAARADRRPVVFVNATGFGEPLIQVLKTHAPSVSRIWAVHFNHGDRRLEDEEKNQVTLGKAFLVSRLKFMLAHGRLHLTHTAEAETLARELVEFEIPIAEDANERNGAFRVGAQDDLVAALGLAIQVDWPGSSSGWMRAW